MKNNKKGFTLAELLIVIAIIAILIAIAIPVFSAQLENARINADHANLRSAYALLQTAKVVGVPVVDASGDIVSGGGWDTDGVRTTAEIKPAWYYTSKGIFEEADTDAIKMTVTEDVDAAKCQGAVGCPGAGNHKPGLKIKISTGTTLADLNLTLVA